MYKIIVVDGKLCWVLAAPQNEVMKFQTEDQIMLK